MPVHKKKIQISIYLDANILALLADYAAGREQSQSAIAEAVATKMHAAYSAPIHADFQLRMSKRVTLPPCRRKTCVTVLSFSPWV